MTMADDQYTVLSRSSEPSGDDLLALSDVELGYVLGGNGSDAGSGYVEVKAVSQGLTPQEAATIVTTSATMGEIIGTPLGPGGAATGLVGGAAFGVGIVIGIQYKDEIEKAFDSAAETLDYTSDVFNETADTLQKTFTPI